MNKTFLNTDVSDEMLKACDGLMARPLYEQKHLKQASIGSRGPLQDHMPDDDHFGIHLIAMGASERYGFNRNGDDWAKRDLQNRHDTFVKHAGFYDEHDHKDPKKSRGPVKFSAYNDEMDRVELVLWGNKRKAEAEWEAVKAGNALAFSMAASVPHDICSICDNEAPTPREYCDHAANSLGQYLDGHQKFAFVRNPNPTFFDISKVNYGADRIAWWLEYAPNDGVTEQLKAASANRVTPSAVIAEILGTTAPTDLGDRGWSSPAGLAMLTKLAAAEEQIERAVRGDETSAEFAQLVKYAHGLVHSHEAGSDELLDSLRKIPSVDVTFGLLKSAGIILPLRQFHAFVSGQTLAETSTDPVYLAATKLASGMYRHRVSLPVVPELESMFDAASATKVACGCGSSDPVQGLLDKVGKDFDSKPEAVKMRIMRLSMQPRPVIKVASAPTELEQQQARALVDTYCHYKISSLQQHSDRDVLIDSHLGALIMCNH